jgi:mono/diheme cytochrome c family protein
MPVQSFIALAALLALAGATEARAVGKVEQGKQFAIEACSACHLVRAGQTPLPPVLDANEQEYVVASTFRNIARAHAPDVAYLRKHFTGPEWPMREQQLHEYYLDDIIAYIQSRRRSATIK